MIEQSRGRIDGRVLGALLLLNLAVHFIPFARPGFHADDFALLRLARLDPPWGFVDHSLVQPTRPLGWLLYILSVKVFGLSEPSQILILVSTSTLLTALVYVWLTGALPRATANLAALAFVIWPVKHEIYSSQLFGVINLAGAMIVISGLLYRRWVRNSSFAALLLSTVFYGLSILTYEIGFLAPLVFILIERPPRSRLRGLAWFLAPAALYGAQRAWHPLGTMGDGIYPTSVANLGEHLLTSLPSNLIGFQVLRNAGYGLFAVVDGPVWFLAWCGVSALAVGAVATRWIQQAQAATASASSWKRQGAAGLLGAVLLTVPAAMVLVEGRHTFLAAIGLGVVVAVLATRTGALLGPVVIALLLLSTQGLARRQAEVSSLQAAVYDVVVQHRPEIRSASLVVFDIASLAARVDYTWGERKVNVLRAYWGLPAFSAPGFMFMTWDVVYGSGEEPPGVSTCARGLMVTETHVTCEQDYSSGEPWEEPRSGTVVIDFKTMPLPH